MVQWLQEHSNEKFFKPGTKRMVDEHGLRYTVQFETALGGLGLRVVGPREWWILVEPSSREAAETLAKRLYLDWTTNGERSLHNGRLWFESLYDRANAFCDMNKAVDALIAGGNVPLLREKCVDAFRERTSRDALVKRCHAKGAKSANSRWKLETLCRVATAA